MATFIELVTLESDAALRNKVKAACIIAAEAIRTEHGTTDNHANRVIWAIEVFTSPTGPAVQMLRKLLASNKDNTVAQITEAADSVIQGQVDAAVDLFATGV
jgi:hypothetical protein